MLSICQLVFTVLSVAEVRGVNIMMNKPSVQSGTYTYCGRTYSSSTANDGRRTGYPSMTARRRHSYWQGDLQGFYTVTSISVTSTDYWGWAKWQKQAIIGVSVYDIGCSDGEVTRCGQWPNKALPGQTLVFNCSHIGPVRFVKIWRKGNNYLSLGEVEVEGELCRLTGTRYDKVKVQKVITPTTSLSVHSVTACGMMCSQTLLCFAFSYRRPEQPNCLLASDVNMTSDEKWNSYKVGMCM